MSRRSIRELDQMIAQKNRGQRPDPVDEARELEAARARERVRLEDEASWSMMSAEQRIAYAREQPDHGPALWLQRQREAEHVPSWEGAGEALQRAESDAAAAADWLSRREGDLARRREALAKQEIELFDQQANLRTANDLRVMRALEARVIAERSALEAEAKELDALATLGPHQLRERWEAQLPAELERLDAEIARQGREQPPVSDPHHEPVDGGDAA